MSNVETIHLSKYGASLGSRDLGAQLRNEVLSLLDNSKRVVFDFGNIEIISTAFADELFGKLYDSLGKERFSENIKLNGFLNEEDKSLILSIIKKSLITRTNSSIT